MRVKNLFYLLLLIGLGWGCQTRQTTKTKPTVKPKPQTTAPNTTTTTSPTVEPGSTNVGWLDSERLMPVLEQAQKEKKPVFVEFYASWCAPCKVLEEEIFTQTEVFRYLNMNFLNFRTDFDSPAGQTIAAIYEVSKLPTVLFLDGNGVVLEKHVGMPNPSVIKSLGDSALTKMQ